jgi:hypothetical protein
MMGQEQLSISSLRLGDMEGLKKFKAFSKGDSVKATIDIEANKVAIPQPMIAQMIARNVSNAFQKNTIEKLSSMNLALKGEVEGSKMDIKHLKINRFRIDNAIMPLEFSMSASDISSAVPNSMILQKFALSIENRAISDVTYESIKSFVDTLKEEDKKIFLKEFTLLPSDMNDRKKASNTINNVIAKRFESDLLTTQGVVKKELIRAVIQMLKGEITTITLEGKNQNNLTMVQVQSALQKSSAMNDQEAKKYMDDKFMIGVTVD